MLRAYDLFSCVQSFGSIRGTVMLDRIALTILIIGGINWGSIGLFDFDIVSWIFSGSAHIVARIIFTLVGLCALWCVSILFRKEERLSAAE